MQRIIKARIAGVVPLLQHRFADEKQTDEPIRRPGKQDYSKEAVLALHRGPDGIIYEPSTHIEGAMLKSSAKFQIGGKGRKTYKDLFKCAIVVEPNAIPHIYQDWTIDRRAVIIGRARIMRERPMFTPWELEFNILVLDEQIPDNAVNSVLIDAGQYVGIGDYRPKFGRFMVKLFEPQKISGQGKAGRGEEEPGKVR